MPLPPTPSSHPGAPPPRSRRSWAVRGLACALGVGLALPLLATTAVAAPRAPAAPTGHPAPTVPVLAWADCGDGFECTSAEVPLDYDEPEQTITLALIRKPAADPARRIGSLFTNPGGPGGPGVNFVRGAAAAFDPEVQARFDIIGMDPRGVAASTPLRCFADEAEQAAFFAPVSPAPVTPEEEQASARAAVELGPRCAAANPEIVAHLSTANVARDLHLLKQAVGDEKLNFYGLSYGTYLGATYANLFPDDVRTLVLDGVVEPASYTGAGRDGPRVPTFIREQSNVGSSETLEEFLDQCAEVGEASCAFAAGGDPRAKFAELAERFRTAPLVVPDGAGGEIPVNYGTFINLTVALLYADVLWGLDAALLQQLYAADDPAALLEILTVITELFAVPPGYNNTPEVQRAIVCADTTNPPKVDAWPGLARAADRRTPYVGGYWAYVSQPCAAWPVQDEDRYRGPWNATTANPALIIGTRFDPATPYRNAEALAEQMPGSRLVTLEGYNHTSFGQGACITGAVGKYLVTGEAPAAGTTCFPDRQPFDPFPTPTPDEAALAALAATASALDPTLLRAG